jgi:squamous cell carcinoma antigen recognized by T-cells 3
LKLLTPDDDSVSALIEFDSKEDAIVAQTRDRKVVDEHTIEVQIGSESTLFVTNFPPTADEAYIHGIFSEACRLSFQIGTV